MTGTFMHCPAKPKPRESAWHDRSDSRKCTFSPAVRTQKRTQTLRGTEPNTLCSQQKPPALHTRKASFLVLMVIIPPTKPGGKRLPRKEEVMPGRQSRQPSRVTLGDYLCGTLGMTVKDESNRSIKVPPISAFTLDGTRAAIGKYVQVGLMVAPAAPIIKNYRMPEEYLEVCTH